MQTTLRIDDALYREAKVQAAKEGISMTKLIEAALRERVHARKISRKPVKLPVFRGHGAAAMTPDMLKEFLHDMDHERDLGNLGLKPDQFPPGS